MIILAIDSTSPFASVAVTDGERHLGEITVDGGNTHSETLLPAVDFLLRTLRIGYDGIDCYTACVGPGSFTGVRIGVSTVKGLAFGKGKPCIPVSALECLAQNLRELPEGSILCPLMDARRQSVFQAFFGIRDGQVFRLTDDRLIALSDLRAEIEADYATDTVYFCGDGYRLATDAMGSCTAIAVTPAALRTPCAYGAAEIANRLLRSGADLSSYTDSRFVPVYLAPSQAERERTEKSAKLNGD